MLVPVHYILFYRECSDAYLEGEGQRVVARGRVALEGRLGGVLEQVVRVAVLGGPVLVGVGRRPRQRVPHPVAVRRLRVAVVHRLADGRQHAI